MCVYVFDYLLYVSVVKKKLKDKSKLSTSIKFYRMIIYLLRYHFEINSFVYIRNTILAGCDGTHIYSQQPLEEIVQRWWFWSHCALKTETCFQRICKITEDKAGHTVQEEHHSQYPQHFLIHYTLQTSESWLPTTQSLDFITVSRASKTMDS